MTLAAAGAESILFAGSLTCDRDEGNVIYYAGNGGKNNKQGIPTRMLRSEGSATVATKYLITFFCLICFYFIIFAHHRRHHVMHKQVTKNSHGTTLHCKLAMKGNCLCEWFEVINWEKLCFRSLHPAVVFDMMAFTTLTVIHSLMTHMVLVSNWFNSSLLLSNLGHLQ